MLGPLVCFFTPLGSGETRPPAALFCLTAAPPSLFRLVFYGLIGDILWRLRFQIILLRGFDLVNFNFTLHGVILPLMINLLDHLLVPYCAARLIGLFYLDSYPLRTLIMRYSFLIYFLLRATVASYGFVKEKIIKLHNDIRDSRYLLGTELNNRQLPGGGGGGGGGGEVLGVVASEHS